MKRLMYVLFFVLLTSGMAYAQQAKYVFYFIGDGMGVNQVNGTEMYLAEQEGRIGVKPLLFTSFPVASMATTFSATNSVTDSSAAGTALATGVKTYNGAIGMDDNKSVLQSVAERAKSPVRSWGNYQRQRGPCYSRRILCPSAGPWHVLRDSPRPAESRFRLLCRRWFLETDYHCRQERGSEHLPYL